ncbi:MAG: prepilin-type N-terminal cleavage/methylation domain-containing protein [Candidatus Omnitrophica bacterium]|nr:prepilin-type N-terminal cleavage/methylation domain-containing protein [Candidatus Omnitrophota bacterium]
MRKKGFTIIELLVVMAVISILIGIAIPRIKGMQDEANITKARAETNTLKTAVESYYINQKPNAYPVSSPTICATTLNSASPLIVSEVLYDPFQVTSTEYNYIKSPNGRYYVMFSVGLDGVADITGIDNAGILLGINDDDIYATNGTGF